MNSTFKNYIDKFQSALISLKLSELNEVADLIIGIRESLNTIYIAGNGGSASCSEHMAIDLMFGTKLVNPSIKTLCLSSNSSSLTATGNDIHYESIFSRQIGHLGNIDDLLIVISASGNSINLINAVNEAKNRGMRTLGILGFDGGKLLNLVDYKIHIKTENGDYGIAEDIQLMVNHLLVEIIKEKLYK